MPHFAKDAPPRPPVGFCKPPSNSDAESISGLPGRQDGGPYETVCTYPWRLDLKDESAAVVPERQVRYNLEPRIEGVRGVETHDLRIGSRGGLPRGGVRRRRDAIDYGPSATSTETSRVATTAATVTLTQTAPAPSATVPSTSTARPQVACQILPQEYCDSATVLERRNAQDQVDAMVVVLKLKDGIFSTITK